MSKPKMQSPDNQQKNIEQIAALFPNVITETKDENGVLKKVINFEKLKQELLDDVIEGEECYDFTWVGKKAAMVEANTPIQKTLRPCIDESKNWETTQNLYIEGDNLEALKLLQESYLNSVKMIYIDPPYNTGKDFIYRDNFTQSKDEYEEEAGAFDEEGNRMFVNSETRGRYHSDWCSMIFPRLKLAHKLLREDGVIFISIDDNEVHNLRKICDEVFGEGNFVASIIWQRAFSPKNDAKYYSENHDYLLVYGKNIQSFIPGRLDRTDEANARYSNPDNDPRGDWTSGDLTVKTYSEKYDYPITTPSGRTVSPSHGSCWRISEDKLNELIADNRIWFGSDGINVPRLKRFISEIQDGMVPTTLWLHQEVGHNQEGRQEVKELFDDKGFFDGPKPIRLLKRIFKVAKIEKDDIILDFFSGSSTTAHAVMHLNSEDSGSRKFIMVQLPEPCDEKSEAFKAGYKTICDIGKERIRRAGEKIKSELAAKNEGKLDYSDGTAVDPESLDIGFRVLKVDSTNMKDVYYSADQFSQESLGMFETNIKDDRTSLDLLYQCLLDWGLPLSLPHTIEKIGKVTLHTVDGNALVACFDDNVPETVIREIAKRQPLRAVFRDSSFASSPEKINVSEIFKTLAPGTSVKVI